MRRRPPATSLFAEVVIIRHHEVVTRIGEAHFEVGVLLAGLHRVGTPVGVIENVKRTVLVERRRRLSPDGNLRIQHHHIGQALAFAIDEADAPHLVSVEAKPRQVGLAAEPVGRIVGARQVIIEGVGNELTDVPGAQAVGNAAHHFRAEVGIAALHALILANQCAFPRRRQRK